jgi:hypothetical protein
MPSPQYDAETTTLSIANQLYRDACYQNDLFGILIAASAAEYVYDKRRISVMGDAEK